MDKFTYIKDKPKYPPQPGDKIVVYRIRLDMPKRVTFVPRWSKHDFHSPCYGFKLKGFKR